METNYINAAGRLAEAEGESKIFQDLRMRLLDPAEIQRQYAASPAWLKTLMEAFADGLNFYLYKHPEVQPRVIRHFEPWMALTFTEGSIGGDYERVNIPSLAAFYDAVHVGQALSPANPLPLVQLARQHRLPQELPDREPRGSNGAAIAPANTAAHHALLLINPHTSFFFRSELQMVSEEGLNAYGAVTWGQFFVYQGFNDRAGWMHTSSGADAIDEYVETVTERGGRYFYKYGGQERPVETREVTVRYRTAGGMAEKKFTIYRTVHEPVIFPPGRERKMGDHPADAGAGEGADAILHAHQGEKLPGVPPDHGAAHQLLQQHPVRRCRRQHRLLPRELHPEA